MSAVTSLSAPPALEALLAETDPAARHAWVRTHAADEPALAALQGAANAFIPVDPARARSALVAIAQVATETGALALAARTRYQVAQTHAVAGQFNIALGLIRDAQDELRRLDLRSDLLRTNLGLVHVFAELGRYPEAVEAAEAVIHAVAALPAPGVEDTRLAGLAWLNLGSCRWHCGAHERALLAFDAAATALARAGDAGRLPDIQSNRALVLLELGRIREALAGFHAAHAAALAAGRTLLAGQALANAGRAHGARGEFAVALRTLEASRRLLAGQETQDLPILLRETADLHLALNLHAEARDAYADAIAAFRTAGARLHLAWALWGAGALARVTGDLAVADAALREAAELFTAADNRALLSGVLLERAALLLARGDVAAARAEAAQALSLVLAAELPVHQAFARLRLAETLGTAPAAEQELLTAHTLALGLGLPQLRFRCELRLGQLRARQGRGAEAEPLLAAALRTVESLRGDLASEALRVSFLGDKGDVFAELAGCHLAAGRAADAFAIAERAKSRALLDHLTGALPAAGSDSPAALHAELHAIYHQLLGAEAGGMTPARRAVLRARAADLETAHQRARLDASVTDGGNGEPLSLDAVQAQLDADTRLVAYYVRGDRLLAFVIGPTGAPQVRELGELRSLRDQMARLRVQLDRCAQDPELFLRRGAELESACRRVLQALHARLLAPLAELVAGVRRLVVVPHGPLHRVPFHALHDGRAYVLEHSEVAYAPSATVWALCTARPVRRLARALIAGCPAPGTPGVAAEVAAVAARFPGHVLLAGETATLAAIRAAAPAADVVHLACHGVFRADNPLFSALRLGDGWLTAAELLHVGLDGALVTLSACETGASHVTGGDETLGLARAALAAGAATVAVSGWRVDDATTARLMNDWYAGLAAGTGRAAALRAGQLALKADHPHPFHWAPFFLCGRR
jgi:tetratricopeptide (TPR) repeat protein